MLFYAWALAPPQVGIKFGERIDASNGGFVVFAKRLIRGGPAEISQGQRVQPGDLLVSLDGRDVRGLGLVSLRDRIRGPPGSVACLGFLAANGAFYSCDIVRSVYQEAHTQPGPQPPPPSRSTAPLMAPAPLMAASALPTAPSVLTGATAVRVHGPVTSASRPASAVYGSAQRAPLAHDTMALAKRPGSSQGQGMQPWQPRQPPPSQQQAALAQRTQSQPGVGLSLGPAPGGVHGLRVHAARGSGTHRAARSLARQ